MSKTVTARRPAEMNHLALSDAAARVPGRRFRGDLPAALLPRIEGDRHNSGCRDIELAPANLNRHRPRDDSMCLSPLPEEDVIGHWMAGSPHSTTNVSAHNNQSNIVHFPPDVCSEAASSGPIGKTANTAMADFSAMSSWIPEGSPPLSI
jgi:hypothetical protein